MNLAQCQLLPGTVVSIEDPSKGIIKCTAPGLFSTESDVSLLPPVVPFMQLHAGEVSSVSVGDLVWVVRELSNTQMLYYIRRYVIPDSLRNIDPEREVFFSRDTDTAAYQFFWSTGEGVKLLNDGSVICINNDGDIDIRKEGINRAISISDDSICLGKGSGEASGVETHAAYGEKVEDALTDIYNMLLKLFNGMLVNPYTSSLTQSLTAIDLLSFHNKISQITSSDVKVV